jgi:hypothetical protein
MEDLRLSAVALAKADAARSALVPGRLLAGSRRAGAYQGDLEAENQRWPEVSIGHSYSSAQGRHRRTFSIFFQAGDLPAEAPARDAGAGLAVRPAPANDHNSVRPQHWMRRSYVGLAPAPAAYLEGRGMAKDCIGHAHETGVTRGLRRSCTRHGASDRSVSRGEGQAEAAVVEPVQARRIFAGPPDG